MSSDMKISPITIDCLPAVTSFTNVFIKPNYVVVEPDFFCSNAAINAALYQAGLRPSITLSNFDLPRLLSPLQIDCRKTINFTYSFSKKSDMGVSFYDHGKTYFTKGDANQDRPNRS